MAKARLSKPPSEMNDPDFLNYLEQRRQDGRDPSNEDFQRVNALLGAMLLKVSNDLSGQPQAKVVNQRIESMDLSGQMADPSKILAMPDAPARFELIAQMVEVWSGVSAANAHAKERDALCGLLELAYWIYDWHAHNTKDASTNSNYSKALILIKTVDDLEPQSIDLKTDLATAYFHNKKYDEADRLLKEILSLDHPPKKARSQMAYLRLEQAQQIRPGLESADVGTALSLRQEAMTLLREGIYQARLVINDHESKRRAGISDPTQAPRCYTAVYLLEATAAQIDLKLAERFGSAAGEEGAYRKFILPEVSSWQMKLVCEK